ncbi:hypothetical protein ASE61_13535 [Bosea sp. Root670]|uniref:hypothetical protein n=1 Tax=Bosea sp. Root670 TaxID=1736583 RepID=UPI0007142EA5|nr:hypothetical protein [Bosea sp. Root670]KRE03480.1 hypothetical protein ASE61_13535 [Bosea sp. Root670]
MHTGKGSLVLSNGRKIAVTYQFGSAHDDTRGGYLLGDTSDLDPALLHDRLRVECEDGADILVAVMHSSDRYLAVTGRVVRPEGA